MDCSELKFKEWLDKRKQKYFFVDQSRESFPSVFAYKNMKRPDFVVFDFDFEKGDVFVDTKSRSSRHKDLILDEEREVKKYMALEQETGKKVYFAFVRDNDFSKWYFISLSKVFYCPVRKSSVDKRPFRAIPLSMCSVMDNAN